MPSSYTSLLGLLLPVQGELTGTWGDTVNNEFTSLVDSAVAGTTTLSTDADVTLTDTTGTANQARQIILNCTGARTVLRTITAPARSKAYIVINNTTGGFGVKIVGVGPTTGVTIANGTNAFVVWNGSDFEVVSSTAISDLTGTLPVANGGTNLTTFPALSLPVANTLDTLSALTATASQSIRVNSGGTAWEAYTPSTGSGDVVGPASAVSGNIATFDGTTGKLIQDSALAVTNTATLNTDQTFTALKTFSGSTSVAATKLTNAKEVTTISATAATGTIDYDVTTQSVLYYTSDASANWTVNFRGSSGTSLDTLMSTGESMTVAFLVTQGATAYYNSAVQVDGSSVTPKWQGGTAPTAGNASGVDAYTYTIVKTGSATFTVFAAQTQFK
jgi:hypothetical protein